MTVAKWNALPIVIAAMVIAGCSVGVDGGTTADLEYVDATTFAGRTVYFDPAVSHRPFLEATEGATPVRVEFYDDIAVAWDVEDGRPVYGPNHMRQVWRVLDRVPTVHLREGSVEPGTDNPPDYYRPTEAAGRGAALTGAVPDGLQAAVPTVASELLSRPVLGLVLVDWRSRLEEQAELLAVIEELNLIHPGCF